MQQPILKSTIKSNSKLTSLHDASTTLFAGSETNTLQNTLKILIHLMRNQRVMCIS